ncbi:MAG: prepilin peptidase [Lachnospiraceae bacterium]|nr:prepilin peptidase [Lachnospiraceae bacterium]
MILPLWFKIIVSVFLFFLGASVYSFLNVVIFRVPRGEEFVKTRSHCPGCGKLLSPMELIPVVSYVCLGGKCKDCGSKIGIRDVLIETFGGLSCIAAFWIAFTRQTLAQSLCEVWIGEFYGHIFAWLTMFAMVGALTVICFIQIDMGVVKNGTLIALAVICVIAIFTLPEADIAERVIGALCLSVFVAILTLASSGKVPIGLAVATALVGLAIGWLPMLVVALPVLLVAALIHLAALAIQKKKPLGKHFRHGFALWVGLSVAVLFGTMITTSLYGAF